MEMNRNTVLVTADDYFITDSYGKSMFYAKSSNSVIYGHNRIQRILQECSLGITYGTLSQILTCNYELSGEDINTIVLALIDTGLLECPSCESYESSRIDRRIQNYETPIPSSVYFHLTNSCNLKCPYCYNTHIRTPRETREISSIELEMILSDLHNYGISELVITGGEPFLRYDLFQHLKSWKKNGKTIQIITNGTLINRDNVGDLADVFDSITISIDSHIPEIANELRGYDVFHKVQQIVSLLNEYNITWKINSVLTSRNIHSFRETQSFFRNLGAESINPTVLNAFNLEDRSLLPELCDIENYYRNDCMDIKSRMDRSLAKEKLNIWYGCGAGIREFAIDPSGALFPCRLLMDDKWKVGQLNGSNFAQLWEESELLESIRKFILEDEKCTDCILSKHCNGGCLAHSDSQPFSYMECSHGYYCHINRLTISRHMELNSYLESMSVKSHSNHKG
jgi:radical SAM protein with 4Fe4S-binding SPASM domain